MKRLTESELAKDFERFPKGTKVTLLSELKTKTYGMLLYPVPEPSTFFLKAAKIELDKALKIEQLITGFKSQGGNPSEIKCLDGYFRSSISLIIFLITALESHLNKEIPDNIKVTDEKNEEVLTKLEIERKYTIEGKISLLCDIKKLSGIKQKPFWVSFKELKNLRDDIIHLKTRAVSDGTKYDVVYASIVDLDLKKAHSAVKNMIEFLS